ncbi:MAG TPA: tetratricopeptide repeat protein [Polyangia bacterium]|jgi:tetratricopeptide (TPR) repeat protein|nr:tetratricopeptide repeat protein [Polyangia bacterium]
MSCLTKKGVSGAVRATFLWTLLVTLAAAHPARAADHQVNELEMKARESFAAGRYDEALQTFAKLYAETLHPVYLRNIGRCHQKMREPQKAIDAFQDYLAKTRSGRDKISADERAEIEGYIKEMRALPDQDAHAAAPPPVTPLATAPVSPAPPPAVPPPAAVESPPAATLAAAQAPPPPEESHPFYTRWWFWTAVGVVALGGVATALALSSGTSQPPCTAPGGCQ